MYKKIVLLKNRPLTRLQNPNTLKGCWDKVSPFDFAKATLRVKIIKLIKVSILKATNRESVRSAVGIHSGSAATAAEVARIGAANRTAPIDAVGTDTVERTIAVEAVARHGQFKR